MSEHKSIHKSEDNELYKHLNDKKRLSEMKNMTKNVVIIVNDHDWMNGSMPHEIETNSRTDAVEFNVDEVRICL